MATSPSTRLPSDDAPKGVFFFFLVSFPFPFLPAMVQYTRSPCRCCPFYTIATPARYPVPPLRKASRRHNHPADAYFYSPCCVSRFLHRSSLSSYVLPGRWFEVQRVFVVFSSWRQAQPFASHFGRYEKVYAQEKELRYVLFILRPCPSVADLGVASERRLGHHGLRSPQCRVVRRGRAVVTRNRVVSIRPSGRRESKCGIVLSTHLKLGHELGTAGRET